MYVRAIRGAITVEHNDANEIIEATKELLCVIINKNEIEQDDIASVIFTITRDLDAAFPALAARQIGWTSVPLICSYEIDVVGSLKSCIRVLMHVNTEKSNKDMKHIYLKGARVLRPDLVEE